MLCLSAPSDRRFVLTTRAKTTPHGDTGVAGAIATLARPFGVNHNLIFSDSSMGSIDGDSEAAPRYTEVELSKFAIDMYFDPLLLKVTEYVDNYLATEKEPLSFVTWCPPLVNHNNSKISVAYATNYPAVNLKEALSLVEHLCKKNAKSKEVGAYSVTDEEVLKFIKGPDFDSGCTIFNLAKKNNTDCIRDFLVNGSTTLYVMPKIEYVKESIKVRGGMADELVIREIPWGATTERIINSIRDANIKLVEVKVKGETQDKSYVLKGREGLVNYSKGVDAVEIRIGLKLGTDVKFAFNSICEILLKEFNVSAHVTMVDDKGQPYRMISYSEMMRAYLNRLYARVEQGLKYERDSLLNKNKLLEAKIEILTNKKNKAKFMEVIEDSPNKSKAVTELAKMFKVSNEIMAAIIEISYSSSVNKGELFKKDIADNLKAIKDIEYNLSDINGFMVSKFRALGKTYGKERKTRVVDVDKLYDSDMLWKELVYTTNK